MRADRGSSTWIKSHPNLCDNLSGFFKLFRHHKGSIVSSNASPSPAAPARAQAPAAAQEPPPPGGPKPSSGAESIWGFVSEIFWFIVENVKGPPALLLLLAAIVVGAIAFLSYFEPTSPLRVYADDGLLVSIGLLIVAAVWAWVKTRRHRSYFTDAAPIQRISEAFEGRDTDVAQVSKDLKERSLVWLVGESGAGKSSLLTKGVLPELNKDPRLVPIYMDYWGTDWEAGPREKLTRELDRVLGDQTR